MVQMAQIHTVHNTNMQYDVLKADWNLHMLVLAYYAYYYVSFSLLGGQLVGYMYNNTRSNL